MRLHSTVHDCLYINWDLDPEAAPDLPSELTYDRRQINGQDRCFASLLLFRQRGLQLVSMPWLPLSHAQSNLRLYVVDGDGRPAVLFVAIWVPWWMSGVMRTLAGVPATSARLRFPRGPVLPDDRRRWSIEGGSRFSVEMRAGATAGGRLGSWRQTVEFFRHRENGYIATEGGLRRVEAVQPEAQATPVAVTVEEATLVDEALGGALGAARLQSAFLCKKLPFEFELSSAASSVPQAG